VIDDPEPTMLLLVALEAALPLTVSPTAELLAALRRQRPDWVLGDTCIVDSVRYTGDDGGIVCRLDFKSASAGKVHASITHLRFNPELGLAQDIYGYQKQRLEKLGAAGAS